MKFLLGLLRVRGSVCVRERQGMTMEEGARFDGCVFGGCDSYLMDAVSIWLQFVFDGCNSYLMDAIII